MAMIPEYGNSVVLTTGASARRNTQNMNPLQDLVNNLANASVASKRAQNSANRYAQIEALPHLALDDQPNIGSAVVSPGAHSLGSESLPSLALCHL